MKKLTLTVLSIFLPLTAQAEEWLCESTHAGAIATDPSQKYDQHEAQGIRWMVDPNGGYKRLSNTPGSDIFDKYDSYEGACHLLGDSNKFLRCENITSEYGAEGATVENLIINTETGDFSYTLNIVQRGSLVDVTLGKCIKL